MVNGVGWIYRISYQLVGGAKPPKKTASMSAESATINMKNVQRNGELTMEYEVEYWRRQDGEWMWQTHDMMGTMDEVFAQLPKDAWLDGLIVRPLKKPELREVKK